MIIMTIFVGLIILFFIWSFMEKRIISLTQYILDYKGYNHKSKDISFLVLSDLHNKRYGKNNKTLINKILDERPDFLIIAGDLITKRKPCYPSNAYDLIAELIKYCPIYYAYGNHEQYFEDLTRDRISKLDKKLISLSESWLLFKDMLLKLGVYLLDNESILLYNDNKIKVTGLSTSTDYYARGKIRKLRQEDLISLIGKSRSDVYEILVAHNPIYYKEYIIGS